MIIRRNGVEGLDMFEANEIDVGGGRDEEERDGGRRATRRCGLERSEISGERLRWRRDQRAVHESICLEDMGDGRRGWVHV